MWFHLSRKALYAYRTIVSENYKKARKTLVLR